MKDPKEININEITFEDNQYYSLMDRNSKLAPTSFFELYLSGKRETVPLHDVSDNSLVEVKAKKSCLQRLLKLCKRKKTHNQLTHMQLLEIRKLNFLNDYAFIHDSSAYSQGLSKCLHFLSSRVAVFESDSALSILWEVLNLLIIIFFFFEIPFQMFFHSPIGSIHAQNPYLYHLILFGIVTFALDIVVTFNTAVYIRGTYQTDRRKIARIYLKKNFLYDFVPTLCLTVQYFDPTNFLIYTNLLFYMKMSKIFKAQNKFEIILRLRRKRLAVYLLVELFLWLIFLCHLFACFFYGISIYIYKRNPQEDTWLTSSSIKANIISLSILDQYSYSFYWSVTTMISVGYGDITPKNTPEVLMTVTTMFVSCIVFAYSINAIWEIIRELNENRYRFQKSVDAINRFMYDNQISSKLRSQIDAYLAHLWHSDRKRDLDQEQFVMKKLAPALREELVFNSYGSMLQKTPFFGQNFSLEFLKELSEDIEEMKFSEGEVIFKHDDEYDDDDFSFYFLISGCVELFYTSSSNLTILNDNSSFGLTGFVTGIQRECSAQCLTYSRIYKLPRAKFIARLEGFERDKEMFHKIRDQVIFKNKFKNLFLKCYVCDSSSHSAKNCDKTHYVCDKIEFVKQMQGKQNKRMKDFNRYTKKKFNALKNRNWVENEGKVMKRLHLNSIVQLYNEEQELQDLSCPQSEQQEFPQIQIEMEEQQDDIFKSNRLTGNFRNEETHLENSVPLPQLGESSQQIWLKKASVDLASSSVVKQKTQEQRQAKKKKTVSPVLRRKGTDNYTEQEQVQMNKSEILEMLLAKAKKKLETEEKESEEEEVCDEAFSIDGMCDYGEYFSEWNPSQILRRVKKVQQQQRRQTLRRTLRDLGRMI